MKLKIHITKEILAKSMNCRGQASTNCAFAVALREIFPEVSVGYEYVFFEDGNTMSITNSMYCFIRKFDDLVDTPIERLNLPEQSFEIEVPDEVIERIGLTEVERILSESKTLERV